MGQHRAMEDKPLKRAASIAGGVAAVGGALVSYLVQSGILNEAQSDAIGTLATAVVGLLAAFGVHLGAKDKLTSLLDPKDIDGNPLVAMLTGDNRDGNDDSGEENDHEPKEPSTVNVNDVMQLPQRR